MLLVELNTAKNVESNIFSPAESLIIIMLYGSIAHTHIKIHTHFIYQQVKPCTQVCKTKHMKMLSIYFTFSIFWIWWNFKTFTLQVFNELNCSEFILRRQLNPCYYTFSFSSSTVVSSDFSASLSFCPLTPPLVLCSYSLTSSSLPSLFPLVCTYLMSPGFRIYTPTVIHFNVWVFVYACITWLAGSGQSGGLSVQATTAPT